MMVIGCCRLCWLHHTQMAIHVGPTPSLWLSHSCCIPLQWPLAQGRSCRIPGRSFPLLRNDRKWLLMDLGLVSVICPTLPIWPQRLSGLMLWGNGLRWLECTTQRHRNKDSYYASSGTIGWRTSHWLSQLESSLMYSKRVFKKLKLYAILLICLISCIWLWQKWKTIL